MKNTGLATVLLLTVLCLISSAASARTWYVNGVSGSDSNDCKSSTTGCKTIGHAISLVASGDSIRVAAAMYTENLTIGISLKILGSGAQTTILDGGGVGRVVTISSADAHVTLSRVTIRNGLSSTAGGGISNTGTLKVINSTVTENVASIFCGQEGCGVVGGGIYNRATLTISNSTVEDNSAKAGSFGSAVAEGGGILNMGRLLINNSTISGNAASAAGQTIHSAGGGIYNQGTVRINNSTLGGNGAGYGGAIYTLEVGGTTINNSTLGGNSADSAGGGIFNGGNHRLTINNSTLGGNSAAFGGAIYNGGGTVMINNGTLGGNSADSVGGIVNTSGGSTALQNSIVANNTNGNCFSSLTSKGYNLSSDNSCNFNNAGDLNNTDPLLGPLQNNGGPTQTMALPSGSPAIDAGNPNGCTDGHGHLLKTDQRGMPRPGAKDTGGCDMGAYESQSD